MVKVIMVSKLEFELNEEVMNKEINFIESIKNGDIEVGVPELTLIDEEGNVLLDMTEEPGIIDEAMASLFKTIGAVDE